MNDTKTTVQLWDEISGKEIQRILLPSGRSAIGGIAADLSKLTTVSSVEASAHESGQRAGGVVSVKLWNVVTGKELQSFQIQSPDMQLDTAVLSPDGSKLFTGNLDGPRLWNLRSGKELLHLTGNSEVVVSAAFSADGRRVITGSVSSRIRLLEAETGKEIQHFAGQYSEDFIGTVNSVAISPDGSQVLTGSNDHTARLWSVETGKELKRFAGHSGPVNCVAFSQDGRRALTGSDDQTARLWSVDTGEGIRHFTGLADQVAYVAFVSRGNRILTTTETGRSWLWDGETGKVTLRPGWPSNGSVSSVAISKDGRRVFFFSYLTGEQRVWDVEAGKEIRHFGAHTFGSESSADFSSDGSKLLATSGGASAWLWDVETGKEVQRFVVKTGPRLPSTEGYTRDAITSVALSLDGKRALTGDSEGTARLWDVGTGKQLRSFSMPAIHPSFVAFLPDGRRMLAGSSDHPAELRDIETGRVLQHFAGYSNPSFSADGHRVLLGFSVWDVETGKQVQRFEAPPDRIMRGTLSADGQRALMTFSDGTTKLLDVGTGKELASLFSFRDGTWAVVDPEGHFDTDNIEGNVVLHWVVDSDPMRPLPLSAFNDNYYTPRLLSHVLKGETLPPVRPIAEKEHPMLLNPAP
jgi:WD40 repeat protein